MSVARVRVELAELRFNASYEKRDRAFRRMWADFKRQVNESGILSDFKERQSFESKGQKKRRKLREAKIRRLKEERDRKMKHKLRDHFG